MSIAKVPSGPGTTNNHSLVRRATKTASGNDSFEPEVTKVDFRLEDRSDWARSVDRKAAEDIGKLVQEELEQEAANVPVSDALAAPGATGALAGSQQPAAPHRSSSRKILLTVASLVVAFTATWFLIHNDLLAIPF
jgi:hypothetical protein